jgi:hypothetical protein
MDSPEQFRDPLETLPTATNWSHGLVPLQPDAFYQTRRRPAGLVNILEPLCVCLSVPRQNSMIKRPNQKSFVNKLYLKFLTDGKNATKQAANAKEHF